MQNLLFNKIQNSENKVIDIFNILKSKEQQIHFSTNELDKITTQLSKLDLGKTTSQTSTNFGKTQKMRTIPFTRTSQIVSGHNPVTESINQHLGLLYRIFIRTNSRTRQLEQIVDIESNIDIGSNSRINTLNPRQLYNLNWFASDRTSLYKYRRIDDFHLPDERHEIIILISEQIGRQLLNTNRRYVRLGLISIGERSLTRSFVGAKAFVVLFDQRFRDNNSQAIIGIIEVDLNQTVSLMYIAPNYTMNLSDFIQNINLESQTIGFGRNFEGHNLH